ncbi:aminoacyl-histidine dipeptidase [Candidatus Collinsella stercoripullorum]|uniref:aminoacyl-histidine dipeptidase n=1 Tax=Candidatus Collinsella stercoripullorum TaxID=2838522 RepID=UPI0022E4729A|nr:aminoacyl-histidine dipeptidase [Candidatus Collinsella stercoripullorum]
MAYIITGYQPEKLFQYFEDISAIPRGSGNEKGISDFLVAFARERGLDVYQDEVYNVIIRKPASAGAEGAAPVMMQGHIDMVCDKLAGVEHDFERDGLELVVEDGVLTANGTTLGADNGIAVALMMTVLDDDTLVHPALECVFTTDEETGLVGAETLDKSQISARIMINLDSEEEGVATVSCAGGVTVTLTRGLALEHVDGSLLTVAISGLLGGHSGSDIHLERGNADLLMARIVEQVLRGTDARLVSFDGGSKDNAITRECTARLVLDAADAQRAAGIARAVAQDIAAELEVFDPSFACAVEVADGASADAMSAEDAWALVRTIRLAPNGVLRRNVAADGFVEVSSNLGVVATEGASVRMLLAPRSSIASLQEEIKDRIQTLADAFGFSASFDNEYPGWSYTEHSHVREVFQASYRELFGEELKIESIHAGLECGLFTEALPGLDAIAVGPTLADVHTPDEHMPLDSAERFYELLVDVLKRLAA